MSINNQNKHPREGVFNTLVQSGTTKPLKTPILLIGTGSELGNETSSEGRTKRKLITNSTVYSLVDVAEELNQHEAVKQYWNTFHCQKSVVSSDGKVYGKYCKNRICTVCNANRKADVINRYLPELKNWDDAQFVTLTIKSCTEGLLNYYIEGMLRTFRLIHERQKKRNQRGKGIKFVGIRSLECNFNAKARTYNPHFHIIVKTKEMAELLVTEWLKTIKTKKIKHVTHKAQKIIPITNHEKALIEIIKYGSKIFTEPDIKKAKKGDRKIYAKALHNILQAMSGQRIFERFGFNLPKPDEKIASTITLTDNYERWTFKTDQGNWINDKTKRPLTGYVAPFELLELLAFRIDKNSS